MSFENLLQLRSFWRHNWYSADSLFPFRHLATANFENVLLIHVLTLEMSPGSVLLLYSPPLFLIRL